MISEPITERRCDATIQSDREFCEHKIAFTRMSYNIHVPTADIPLIEEAEKYQSALQEPCVADDNPDGPYNFQVVPPTPNSPGASMLEKQGAPGGHPFLQLESDKFIQYLVTCHLDEGEDQEMLRVVDADAGSDLLCDPPPYTSLDYERH